METQVRSIEALRAELARQDEECTRLSRIAAENDDVRFAIGDEVDAKIGELLVKIERDARRFDPEPTSFGVRM